MSSRVKDIETAIEKLVEEPAFSAFSGDDAGILVWSEDGRHILWASQAAQPLKNALAKGEHGEVALPELEAARIQALASGAAPQQGMQLERLRLNPLRYSAPLTCACRLINVHSYGDLLVTAIAGQVPLAGEGQSVMAQEALPDDRVGLLQKKQTIRFIWQADANLRITSVSDALAEAVGEKSADIIGQRWPELLARLRQEKPGVILSHLEQNETWSGEVVFWPIDQSQHEVGVELAGFPVLGASRELVGYRGFGLCRADTLVRTGASVSVKEVAKDKPAKVKVPVSAKVALPVPDKRLSDADKLTLGEIARTLGGPIMSGPSGKVTEKHKSKHSSPEKRDVEIPTVSSPAILHSEKERVETPPQKAEELMDLLPTGVLIHRGEDVIFANRMLLQMVGYPNIDKLVNLGVLGLFRDSPVLSGGGTDAPFVLTNADGEKVAVEVRLSTVEWKGIPASLMLIRQSAETNMVDQLRKSERDSHERGERIRELEAILATATDGIVTLDETGSILSLNSSGEALFGYDAREVVGEPITTLLAAESHIAALDYIDGLRLSGVASLLEGGREVTGRVKQGGTIPLFMTIGRINDLTSRKLCVVLRDITAFKKAESELLEAKRAAEEASEQKSDLLAKISHEIRTPLNAIIGFAELMMEERLGPIHNERYKSYLKDMHTSGTHVMSLVNDLLDLAKIEAGHMDLSFSSVHLNELVASCVGLMQQQAANGRIIMRTSFAHKLPPVVADERSVRQIVLNLVSNAIKFTDAGGQVIVSTAMTDLNEVVIRVRDTGIGMSSDDIIAAMEPFRQLATSRQRGGTGLGLPLTKALIEANRGSFEITSAPREGTLVEVVFPPTRVLAE
ncbi:ATP-binding protein [Microvirga sp. W0021]|uniref:histidine kinase n=1 Tax=Hohaiivirga grylli TaxID=3133970 RepID=A0ABV0BGW2_9HYPH